MKRIKSIFSGIAIAALSVSLISGAASAQSEQNIESLKVTSNNGRDIKIFVEDKLNGLISSQKVKSIIENAKIEIVKEKKVKKSDEKYNNGTYQYILYDDSTTYFYEEPANEQPSFFISASTPTVAEASQVTAISPLADSIGDGVGGRQTIVRAGNLLTTKLKLPVDSDVTQDKPAYNYIGFFSNNPTTGGNYAADMGLVFDATNGGSGTEKGWKGIVTFSRKLATDNAWVTQSVTWDPAFANVSYNNAYKSNADVILYAWYNYNGKVRLKIDGVALCADAYCNNPADTALTTVIESTQSYNLSPSYLQYWKLLSTVVSSDNTGKNKAYFSSIKVDETLVPSSSFQTPVQDHALVTRDASNNVTIVVNSSIYP